MLKRYLYLAYGLLCYVMFLGVFLYAIGWLAGVVPNSIDGSPRGPFWESLAINALLLSVFAVQHSLMARPFFKRWWTRVVPKELERSTYVLFSNLALILVFWQWRPMGGVVWHTDAPWAQTMLWTLYGAGWLLVLVATLQINHFDLFGLRQSWLYFKGRPYTRLIFTTPFLYRHVRHPLYVGWLTVFWATPTMTAAHLLFALMTTAYILVAIQFEEHDLVDEHGEHYAAYRKRVPMLVPRLRKPAGAATPPAVAGG